MSCCGYTKCKKKTFFTRCTIQKKKIDIYISCSLQSIYKDKVERDRIFFLKLPFFTINIQHALFSTEFPCSQDQRVEISKKICCSLPNKYISISWCHIFYNLMTLHFQTFFRQLSRWMADSIDTDFLFWRTFLGFFWEFFFATYRKFPCSSKHVDVVKVCIGIFQNKYETQF